jgi:hypothetical protein
MGEGARWLPFLARLESEPIKTEDAVATPLNNSDVSVRHRINVTRVLLTGGVTAGVVFVLCWIGALVPFSGPTHAYIGLFTNADMGSGRALVEGSVWSSLFGGLTASLFALIYNAAAALDRR